MMISVYCWDRQFDPSLLSAVVVVVAISIAALISEKRAKFRVR